MDDTSLHVIGKYQSENIFSSFLNKVTLPQSEVPLIIRGNTGYGNNRLLGEKIEKIFEFIHDHIKTA